MRRTSLSSTARWACLDQVNRAMFRSALGGIPASALLVLILGASVPLARRLVFVGLVSAADVVAFFATRSYLRRRSRGLPVRNLWASPLSVGLISAAWGSLALIGMPNARHSEMRVVFLLFACGISATYVVGAAAHRLYYYSSQTPLLGLAMIGFLASSDRSTRMLGYAVPVYFVVMTMLHNEVHGVVVSEIELRERNALANAELRKANTELARRAAHDSLTDLANRATFTERLQQAIVDHEHVPGAVGVMYIDLDRFKVVNDSLGHSAGDELLGAFAQRMRALTRGSDLLARFGGDEFTMLLDGLDGSGAAMEIAQRVAAALDEPYRIAGRTIHVSASIGIAISADPADDAELLIARADAAQYRAKQSGRNRIEIFDAALRDTLAQRLDEEMQLRAAITGEQIVAWYQPVVDLGSGAIAAAEALARWQHPVRGVLDAGRFVPLAEETGLVQLVDDVVIRQALTARAAMHPGGAADGFRVWVNVSTTHFKRDDPIGEFRALLEAIGCAPRHVGVEITETAVLEDVPAAAAQIATARELGIKVALDDFGVGHSSLTLLRSLPISTVKIDRSFVRDITDSGPDAAIVESVIALSDKLGIEVVGEGVETPEQARVLRDLGCPFAQGFLWDKALPVATLAERLGARDPASALATDPVS